MALIYRLFKQVFDYKIVYDSNILCKEGNLHCFFLNLLTATTGRV